MTEDWCFWSHRLALARKARDAGYRVVVATCVDAHGERLRAEGFELHGLERFNRGSTDPWDELRSVAELVALYRRVKPDITHHVAVKPVLYGAVAARLAGVPVSVNALTGLGWAFTQQGARARVIETAFSAAFRLSLSHPGFIVLFQNPDDRDQLVRLHAMRAEKTVLIRGSGVDTVGIQPQPSPPPGPVVIVLGARMLRDKGVGELVDAARILKQRGVACIVRLLGDPDPQNPSSFTEAELRAWRDEGVVEWNGATSTMTAELGRAHIACLPSYREGLPKFLLEAAAAGLPLVTTDVPGCREVVDDGNNGYLVAVRQAAPLADALERLIRDPDLRARMGAESRRRAEDEFSERRVIAETLALYERLLR